MKKKYATPVLSVESIYVSDSMCASRKDCVAEDDATDTFNPATGKMEGYVYVNNGVLTYCRGFSF